MKTLPCFSSLLPLLAFLILSGAPSALAERPGTLLKNIGLYGFRLGHISTRDVVLAVLVQDDGKIVAAGSTGEGVIGQQSFALARHHPDGSLDEGFGVGGKVVTGFSFGPGGPPARVGGANGLALQADGKILAAGSRNGDFALARYLPDGGLDLAFGEEGKVITDFGDVSEAHALDVAVRTDGKIIAAGFAGGDAFVVACYLADGTLDSSFGNAGKVTGSIANISGGRMILQADGKIILSGNGMTFAGGGAGEGPGLIRLNPDGGPDASFGVNGRAGARLENSSFALDLALQEDGGMILFCAQGTNGESRVFTRFTANGGLDESFGENGRVVWSSGRTRYFDLAPQPDGKMVVAGWSAYGFAAARFHADGTPDTGFAEEGSVIIDVSAGQDEARCVTVQSDGRILLAGMAADGEPGGGGFALARCLPDGTLDGAFGFGGTVVTTFGAREEFKPSMALRKDGSVILAISSLSGERPDLVLIRAAPSYEMTGEFGVNGRVTAAASVSIAEGNAVAIQADGKILTAGTSNDNGGDFVVARCLPDGTLDAGFGVRGRAVADFGGGDRCHGVAALNDGKILAAGTAWSGAGRHLALARWNADGTLDGAFGNGGKLTAPVYTETSGGSLAIQRDGKILVAVTGEREGRSSVLRFLPNGKLDAGFGREGRAELSRVNAITLQEDGKILLAGSFPHDINDDDLLLSRLNADGFPDTAFGDQGTVYIFSPGGSERASAVLAQEDGRIFISGTTWTGEGTDILLLCRLPDGSPDPGFGIGGKVVTSVTRWNDTGDSVLRLDDGRILVAGTSTHPLNGNRVVLNSFAGNLHGLHLWRHRHFGTLENAGSAADGNDPDGDGLENVLEWACGLNPLAADPPPFALTPAGPRGTEMEFTYQRTEAARDAGSLYAEYSHDLTAGKWWRLPGPAVVSNDGIIQRVKVTLPASRSQRLFVRLKAVGPR